MSVQTEITRIQSAKRAISEAIGGKGVTVPPTAKLDDLAALVAQITQGGGGGGFDPAPFSQIEVNTYVPVATVNKYTIANPENVRAVVIMTDPIVNPPTTVGFSVSSMCVLPGGKSNIADPVWTSMQRIPAGPNGKLNSGVPSGSFNRSTGEIEYSGNGLMKSGQKYAIVIMRGDF